MQDKYLTVGELRDMLAQVPDDVYVVVDSDGWYDNVEWVQLPTDDGYVAVTLYRGASFDVRQS